MQLSTTDLSGSSFGQKSNCLSSIKSSDINFSLWQRDLSQFLNSWAEGIKWQKAEVLEGEVNLLSLDTFESDLFIELKKWQTSEPDMTKWVAQDMALNIKLFIESTGAKEVFVKVEPVASDMCKLLHVDSNYARMLCTYVGDGTLWLPNSMANRNFLGKGNNDDIAKDPNSIFQAGILDVLILKGGLWPINHIGGAIHRSPPIRNGQNRLLLKVDFIK